MAKITVIASPHGKKYDEIRASHMAKERFNAYFMELPPGIIEEIGTHPRMETSYNFAKENNIPIHFVDDDNLLSKHCFVDSIADRISYSLLSYHLKNAGYDFRKYLTGVKRVKKDGKKFEVFDCIPLISNKTELRNAIDLLSTAYQASYGCVRERSSAIAKNTDFEIRKNGYKTSILECGNAHKDIADMLKEKHEVELIVLGDDNYNFASNVSTREVKELQKVNDVELPQDVRDNIFNMRRLDQEEYMKFICQKISFETLRKDISDIYLK